MRGDRRVYSVGTETGDCDGRARLRHSALGGCAGLNDLFKEPTFRLERVVVHDVGLHGRRRSI